MEELETKACNEASDVKESKPILCLNCCNSLKRKIELYSPNKDKVRVSNDVVTELFCTLLPMSPPVVLKSNNVERLQYTHEVRECNWFNKPSIPNLKLDLKAELKPIAETLVDTINTHYENGIVLSKNDVLKLLSKK